MTNEEAIRILGARFPSPVNLCRHLGLDESLLSDLRTDDDDGDPDGAKLRERLEFVQSKLSSADFIKYICARIISARQSGTEGEDRRTAKDDLRRSGDLETTSLRRGITPSAPGAQDAMPGALSFREMFPDSSMPGTC